MAESKLPPVPAAEVLGAEFRWDHLRNQQQRLSGPVNGAAWGHIFGKQDCNRAGSLPRAVLTHARHNSYFPNNPAPANLNQLQPRKEALHWFFTNNWLTGPCQPHSPTAVYLAASVGLTWKTPVDTFWNFIWEPPGVQHHEITECSALHSIEDFSKKLIKSLCTYKWKDLDQKALDLTQWFQFPKLFWWSFIRSNQLAVLFVPYRHSLCYFLDTQVL